MKHFLLFFLVMTISFFTSEMKAEKQDDVVYFYIENLSPKMYSNWYTSLGKSEQPKIKYACIPAKIIGVKKENVELFRNELSAAYKDVKEVRLTKEQAEKKCANQRKL